MKKFLLSVVIGVLLIGVPSCVFIYLYSHEHPIYRKSLETLRGSEAVRRHVGDAFDEPLIVYLKVSERHQTGEAEYRLRGERGSALAKVSARLEEGEWHFRWIWLELEDGRYRTVVDNRETGRQ